MLGLLPACAGGLILFSGAGLPLLQLFKDTATALLYATVLLIVLQAPRDGVLNWALSQPALSAIGKYSYGMYVLHMTIIGLLTPLLRTTWPLAGFFLTLGVITSAAALSWHLFEQPFLRLKSRFHY